jgi:hypothetical protein
MAWQWDMASAAQIAAKASERPTGRNLATNAIAQRIGHHYPLAGTVGGIAPLFKRRITVDWPSPCFPKVG